MARIRTIKPQFWTDGKNKRLTDSCALFYIGLWNFCDDEGKYRIDLDQLCAELGGRWRKDKVSLFLVCLAKTGQIRVSLGAEWIQITGWSHQKIDKPKQPDVKTEEIQWVDEEDSANVLESSRMIDARIGKDRIVEDRIVEDRIGKDRIVEDRIGKSTRERKRPALPVARRPKADVSLTNEVVAVYCDEWKARYHESAIILPYHAKQMKTLVETVGAEKAKHLVRAYFQMNDTWYLKKRHDIHTLITNISAVQQFAGTGKMITSKEAQDIENQETLLNQLDRLGGEVA